MVRAPNSNVTFCSPASITAGKDSRGGGKLAGAGYFACDEIVKAEGM